jgi:sulfur relay protein TusB/DsrH
MLVIIKNAPDTSEAKRGVKLASALSADIVLLQNGVYFSQGQKLGDAGCGGRAYILEDDMLLRGLKTVHDSKKIQEINYDSLVDLMTEHDKVIGMF